MTASSPLRRWARALLPRPIVLRLAALVAYRQRRAGAKKLPSATQVFDREYSAYWRTGDVPPDADDTLFLATWSSGGTYPQSRVQDFGAPFDPVRYREFPDVLLQHLDTSAIAGGVEEEGLYVVPDRLSDEVVDDILGVLESGPARPQGDGLGALPVGVPGPSAPTWWMDPSHSLRSAAVRRLLCERRLAETAGLYLGVDPMIMSVVLWKSLAWRSPDKTSAQHFHCDSDRPAFIKMFVYLTDVGEANGPHTYVRRSHRQKPRELLHGQRLSDKSVARFFPEDGWAVVTGARGTMFFADTHGFHKGGHVASGARAMFQINLASDRFGVGEPPVGEAADAPPDMAPTVSSASRFFSQVFTPPHLVP